MSAIFSETKMRKPLLTKISPPQARQLLSRPRLLAQLERSQKYRLLLISAGTGFGKTTLLIDFARQARMALAWYALDESDRDPATFCHYLLASVRQIYPSFGQSFELLLRENLKELHQEPILYRLAEEFIADLELLNQNDTAENFRETLLVLDDFQFAESFSVNRFMQRLLWWLPPNFHVIMATRVLPEDLMLNKMLAKQMMAVLGSSELAFTPDEVKELLRCFYHIEDDELSDTLANYSEGWITAIILALSSQNLLLGNNTTRLEWQKLKNASNLEAEEVFNYLAQEVLENQTPEVQDFLIRTSVFNLMNPASCELLLNEKPEGVAGREFVKSENLLKQLETRNLFVTRVISEGHVYFQYHSLFRQFLFSKLKQNKALYHQVQLRAAQAQKELGNHAEAVQHYVASGEIGLAAMLLNEIVESLYEAGRFNLLSDLLEGIPGEEQNKLAHILNIKGKLLLEKGSNEQAIKTLAQAEQIYRKEHAYDFAARVAVQQAELLLRTGHRQEALLICTGVLTEFTTLMQTLEGQKAVAFAKHTLGNIAIEEGHNLEAEKYLREASEIYKAAHDDFRIAAIDSAFGQLYQNNGRLIKSNIYYERAIAYYIKIGNRSRETYSRTNLAINRYLQGQYQQAEEQLNEILALIKDLKDRYLQAFVLAYLANIYRETERYNKAEITYIEALEVAREAMMRRMELALLNDQTTNFILTGKEEEANELVRWTIELTEEYKLPERAGLSYLNQGWLELGNRAYKRALSSIERALDIFRKNKARPEEARTKLTLATILLAMKEPRKALATLTESLEVAEELGFEPFLPFEIKWATPVFEYAIHKKVSETVETFLRRHNFITYEVPGASQVDLPEPLQFNLYNNRKQTENRPAEKPGRPNQENVPDLRVYALSGGRVWKTEAEVEDWRNAKAREAFFYLLEYKKCTRDELIEALWPDEDSLGNSIHALHNILFLLRKAIGPKVTLKLSTGRYQLDGEIWYDATEFSNQVQVALSDRELDVEGLTNALNLYKREFLDQFYANWIIERQQQLLQLYLKGLEKLACYYSDNNQPQMALPLWRQLLFKDSFNEEAHRAVMNCLLALGKKGEAQQHSKLCIKALEELDLTPSPETTLLLQKLA